MSRSIEIGRAVLSCQSASLQLWLTTLITISPEQESINQVQHHNRELLLEYLLSRDAWVRRGRGLHLDLVPSIQGGPLDLENEDKLAEKLVNAPVWSQLNLRVTLPGDFGDQNASERGKIRLHIAHARVDGDAKPNSRHRMFHNVPFADINPPEGIPVINLESVSLRMEVICLAPRSQISKSSGQPKTQKNGQGGSKRNLVVSDSSQGSGNSGNHDDLLVGGLERRDDLSPVASPAVVDFGPAEYGNKRQRVSTITPARNMSNPTAELLTHNNKCGRTANTSSIPAGSPPNWYAIESLIESALRVSFCSGTPKFVSGIRTVTSTFMGGLSDIAPALFGVDYLPALSQRAHLMPTISRSLNRAKLKSPLLRNKLATLTHTHSGTLVGPEDHDEPQNSHNYPPSQSLEARLWMHCQKQIPIKGKYALRSFLDHTGQSSAQEVLLEDHLTRIAREGRESGAPVDVQNENVSLLFDNLEPHGLAGDLFTEHLESEIVALDQDECLFFDSAHAEHDISGGSAQHGQVWQSKAKTVHRQPPESTIPLRPDQGVTSSQMCHAPLDSMERVSLGGVSPHAFGDEDALLFDNSTAASM